MVIEFMDVTYLYVTSELNVNGGMVCAHTTIHSLKQLFPLQWGLIIKFF